MRSRTWSRRRSELRCAFKASLVRVLVMESELLYWTKIAAVGQVMGALATFFAAFLALYFSVHERALKVKVSARFGQIVDIHGSTPVMSVEVENIGIRPVIINGLYWTTGIGNRFGIVPRIFRLKSAFQITDYEWSINKDFPWTLEPGQSRSTHMRRPEFISAFETRGENDLFRKFPWSNKSTLFRHRVNVGVSTLPRVVSGTVDPKITKALIAAYGG